MPVARSVVSGAPRCGVSSGGGSGPSGAVPCRRRRTPGRSPTAASSAGRGLGERLAPALTPVRGLCRCAVGRFPGQRHHPPGWRRRLSPPGSSTDGSRAPVLAAVGAAPGAYHQGATGKAMDGSGRAAWLGAVYHFVCTDPRVREILCRVGGRSLQGRMSIPASVLRRPAVCDRRRVRRRK